MRRLRKAALVFFAGIALATMGCIPNLTDAFGTGLSFQNLIGPFGATGQPENPINVAFDLLAGLFRLGA